jgi:serine/threonine protein phosphatase PrpC
MSEMMETEDPILTLANYITASGVVSKMESSGSTMNMVKVFEKRLECFNCGDSQALVFVDGIAVHKTVKHHAFNPTERKRVTEMGCKFAVSFSITVVDEENMHGAYSERVLFPVTRDMPVPLQIVPTQALGHNSKTGYTPSKHEIPIDDSSTVKIIIASDGVWDMRIANPDDSINNLFKMSAAEISQQSEGRWKKLWKMTQLDEKYQPTKELPGKMKLGGFDDVSVIVVDISPVKNI